ncbi:hypothetical protein [Streptomyces tendae]|uniref:hypothetical protein n=1 Tax=Streptomyces tendae TaxID=1932 RepID=UPI0033CEB18C
MPAERRRNGTADPVLVHSAPTDATEQVPELATGRDIRVPGPAGVTVLLTVPAEAFDDIRRPVGSPRP